MTNFSILIVEDDEDARSNMEDILSLDGYEIKTVSHCLPAINAAESNRFDAVIIDWRLPDGNGGNLIPLIRERLPDAPVIVVTGLREFDAAVTALREGAYDFISKPINPDAFRSLIGRIVERKDHIEKLNAAQQKLVENERLAAIGEMVTGLAHESRNAFQRSHACLAELSLDLTDKPESMQLVRKIQKALDDVNLLLEEVRNYAAPINLEKRECALIDLVKEAWDQAIEVRLNNQSTLKVIEKIHVDNIYVDGVRLKHVLRNLFENALDAKDDSPVTIELEEKAETEPLLEIRISDHGKGISQENLANVFTPFFTTKTKGTGLGLAISRRYIESHGGELYVDPDFKEGARFVIKLPNKTKQNAKTKRKTERKTTNE